jgi:hypothetical protein
MRSMVFVVAITLELLVLLPSLASSQVHIMKQRTSALHKDCDFARETKNFGTFVVRQDVI